jgi:hypothetical protein
VKQSWEFPTVGRNDLNFPLLCNMLHKYQEYNTQRCNSFPQCCKRDGWSDKWKQDDMWNMYSIMVRTGPLRLLLELYRKLLIYSGTIYSTKMSKRHEILVYLLARSLNFILFYFIHFSTSIKILFDSRQVECVHVRGTIEGLSDWMLRSSW